VNSNLPVDVSADSAQSPVLAFLNGIGGPATRRIDTHAASIFLTHNRAWKLKRAIKFGYLDFTTPQRRRSALEAELVLNRRTAPDLYIAVHPLTQDADGALSVGGKGRIVDWLLEMQRFPDDALLSEQVRHGRLEPAMLRRLAEKIHAFHDKAKVTTGPGAAAGLRKVIVQTAVDMGHFPAILDPDRTKRLVSRQLALCGALTPLLDRRGGEGRVRHCHGDLHLGNIAIVKGEPTLFDCLEFSDELATIDVLYDLSFLLMDLWHSGAPNAANIIFNTYLDLSPADEEGIAMLPLMLSERSAIRAYVLAAQCVKDGNDQALADQARDYLASAEDFLASVDPCLVAIGGLSGSGKSTLAQRIGDRLGRPPGARIHRSDVVRKQMAGVRLLARLPADAYAKNKSAAVYQRLGELAADTIRQGSAAIVDAVFADEGERTAIEKVADEAGVAFNGLWLEAGEAVRSTRVGSRGSDPSDADPGVARAQSRYNVGELGAWRRMDAAAPLAELANAAMETLQSRARHHEGEGIRPPSTLPG